MPKPKRPDITKQCKYCGNDFTLPAWRAERVSFCSTKCSGKYNYENGTNSGMFKKGMTAYNKGIPANEETRKRLAELNRGKSSWNKGIPLSPEHKEKARQTRINNGSFKRTLEQNIAVSARLQGVSIEEWKGFVSGERKQDCNSLEWRKMRRFILIRDGYKCQHCGDHNYKGRGSAIKLHVHHIKQWITHPELRFDPENLILLCSKCHNEVHKKLRHTRKSLVNDNIQ